MASIFDYAKKSRIPMEGEQKNENQYIPSIFNFAKQNKAKKITPEDEEELIPPQPSQLEENLREIPGQLAKGTAAGSLGAPGNLLDLINAQPREILSGEKEHYKLESDILEKMQKPGYVPSIGELDLLTEEGIGAPRYSRLPSSKDISETVEAFGGPGKPKTTAGEASERFGEIYGSGLPFGMINPIPALTASMSGQLAKELNASPNIQFAAETIPLLLSSISLKNGKDGAARFASSKYAQAEAALPENASINASKLRKNLTDLRKKVTQGTLAPSEKFVADEVDAVLSKVKDGKISPQEAWASKRSLNEKLENLLYTNPDKKVKARARKLATGINKELDDVISTYGKENPAFYKPFKEGEEAFATIAQSRKVSNFIAKHANLIKGSTVSGLFLEAFSGHPQAILPTVGAAAIGTGILKGGELLYRVLKSPVLRKHYFNVIKDAIREDAPAMNQRLKKLNEKMEDDPLITDLSK